MLKKEVIIEKISYERRAYESVDDRATFRLYLKNQRKTKLRQYNGLTKQTFSLQYVCMCACLQRKKKSATKIIMTGTYLIELHVNHCHINMIYTYIYIYV